ATRDAWSYVVFLKNAAGQASLVSNQTLPMPDYILGDVCNGVAPGVGDNVVDEADLSLLGAHYGGIVARTPAAWLDVGPTTDRSDDSRPETDGRVDFEDLFMLAMHYRLLASQAAALAAADSAPADPAAPE